MSAGPAFFGVSTEWPQNILPAVSVLYSQCDPLDTEHYSMSPGEMVPFFAEACKGEAVAGAKRTSSHNRIASTNK